VIDNEVVISGEGWHVRDVVEFVRMHAASDDGVDLGFDVLGLGRVRAARADRARVLVPIDTRVVKGTLVRRSAERYSEYSLAPARLGGIFSVGADLRPYLPLGKPIGFGFQGAIRASYRFGLPIALHASLSPIGGVTPAGSVVSGGLILALDTQYFEIGIGVGGTSVAPTYFSWGPGAAVTLMQLLRFGAVDGLMLQAQTDVYALADEFQFNSFTATGQIPIVAGWWILLRGGGGVGSGFIVFETGVRHLMIGNGDHQTVFLTALVGVAGITKLSQYGGMAAGPSVCLGLEWRP
jgi:hypothetical protein